MKRKRNSKNISQDPAIDLLVLMPNKKLPTCDCCAADRHYCSSFLLKGIVAFFCVKRWFFCLDLDYHLFSVVFIHKKCLEGKHFIPKMYKRKLELSIFA